MTLPKKAKAKPKKKRPLGRKPDAISEEQTKALVKMISGCVSTKAACEALRIDQRMVYNWLERGEATDAPEIYRQFRQRILYARGIAKTNGVKILTKAAKGPDGDWRAMAWLLERMYPDDFRPPDKIQHEVKGAVQHDHTHKQIVVVMPAAIAHPRPIRQIEQRQVDFDQPTEKPQNPAP